jgi:hypothetical protein
VGIRLSDYDASYPRRLIFTRQQVLYTLWRLATAQSWDPAGVDTTLKVHTISISTIPIARNVKLHRKWTRAHNISIMFHRNLTITQNVVGDTHTA